MLEHPNAYNFIKALLGSIHIQVIFQAYIHQLIQAQLMDPPAAALVLFPAESNPRRFYTILLCRTDDKPSPPTADIQQMLTGLQMQLAQTVIDLVELRLLQCILRTLKISTGIGHRRIQPQGKEIISQIIMTVDILPLRLPVFLLKGPQQLVELKIPFRRFSIGEHRCNDIIH